MSNRNRNISYVTIIAYTSVPFVSRILRLAFIITEVLLIAGVIDG